MLCCEFIGLRKWAHGWPCGAIYEDISLTRVELFCQGPHEERFARCFALLCCAQAQASQHRRCTIELAESSSLEEGVQAAAYES